MEIVVSLPGAAARVRVVHDIVIEAPAPFTWMLNLCWEMARNQLFARGGNFRLADAGGEP